MIIHTWCILSFAPIWPRHALILEFADSRFLADLLFMKSTLLVDASGCLSAWGKSFGCMVLFVMTNLIGAGKLEYTKVCSMLILIRYPLSVWHNLQTLSFIFITLTFSTTDAHSSKVSNLSCLRPSSIFIFSKWPNHKALSNFRWWFYRFPLLSIRALCEEESALD